MPCETATCGHPGCGAPIGGEDHVPVEGTTKVALDEMRRESKSCTFAFFLNV